MARPVRTVTARPRPKHKAAEPPAPPDTPTTRLDPLADTTVCVTCLFRFDALERFLSSLRRFYPTIACVVADNSFRLDERNSPDHVRLINLCRRFNAELVNAPFDSGCAKTRNLAVAAATTPYVIVCEEDFEFTPETNLEKLLRPIRLDLADCVGGIQRYTDPAHHFHRVPDPPGYSGVDCFQWCARLEITDAPPFERTLEVTYPSLEERGELAGVICRQADLIHNFYAIRRDLYMRAPNDPRLKVDEHLDHFLRLKAAGSRTYYTPEVVVDHHSPAKHATTPVGKKFAKLRCRNGEFRPLVYQTWKLKSVPWGIKITKIPPICRDTTPSLPNVVILTAGRTGSGLLVQMLLKLGWQRNDIDIDGEWKESEQLYTLNERLLRGEITLEQHAKERDAYLESLSGPWILKDPRLGQTWNAWQPRLLNAERPPLVILSTRDAADVRTSYHRKGWDPTNAHRRAEAAESAFARWPGPKIQLSHEAVTAAALLVDPARLTRRLEGQGD